MKTVAGSLLVFGAFLGAGEAAEDRDEYTAENIFWVPPEARWAHLKAPGVGARERLAP